VFRFVSFIRHNPERAQSCYRECQQVHDLFFPENSISVSEKIVIFISFESRILIIETVLANRVEM